MALGTPTDGGAAYSANNGNSVSPAYPAVIAAGDCLVLIIGQKPSTANGGTVTTPTGWTLRESLTGAGGYGTTLAADTGNTNLFFYTKNVVNGTETGTLSVTLGTNNISWGLIVNIPTGNGTLVYGSADGSRITAPTTAVPFTTLLTDGTTAPALKSADMALWAMCIPTDVLGSAGFSAPTITSTGTTFGTPIELEEPSSSTGQDIGGYVAYALATAGTSAAAPTVGVTATGTVTNVRGPIGLLRIRELPFINAEVGSFTYTGQAATLAATRNLNAEVGSFTYTGQNATLAIGYVVNAETGGFTYTGQDASFLLGSAINAEVGSFTYTGQAATLAATRNLNAETGTFTYTGQNASLLLIKNLNAEVGSFTYTGEDASLLLTRAINAEVGSFTYTGQDASLLLTRAINAEVGSFTYTGQDASLLLAIAINAETGTFTYTGQDASLLLTRAINAETGTFTYTGEDAFLLLTRAINAETGTFTYTGEDASFLLGSAINAEVGSFTYTGMDAALIASGTRLRNNLPLWLVIFDSKDT